MKVCPICCDQRREQFPEGADVAPCLGTCMEIFDEQEEERQLELDDQRIAEMREQGRMDV